MLHHHEDLPARSPDITSNSTNNEMESLQVNATMRELRDQPEAKDERPEWLKQAMTKVGLGLAGATIITGTFTTDPAHALSIQPQFPGTPSIPEEVHARAAAAIPQTPEILTQVIERSLPATVQIDTKADVKEGSTVRVRHGSGSGFFFRDDGYIVTNHHVIEGAKEVGVTLISGERVLARVIGTDPASDIAVLKITTSQKVPTLPLGNSNELKQGEIVIALGNPMGLENTATVGIVSSTHRSTFHVGLPNVLGYIQTDAAINPGNSGGALLNLRGEVIGINDAVLRNADNLGFALPISEAKRIISELTEHGKVTHSVIGIEAAPLTHRALELLRDDPKLAPVVKGVTPGYGAVILRVQPKSVAEGAGLRPGDIVKEINGEKIKDDGDLRKITAATPKGELVQVKITRGGTSKTISVPVSERPADAPPFLL